MTVPDADSSDFSAFVAERQRPLLRFAMVLCGDARLAEDLVADVLAKAYEKWARIATVDQPNAYVRRMVVNEYLSWRRRLHRTAPLHLLTDEHLAVPDHTAEHAERAELAARLATLPRKQRATLVLRYYAGLSDPEIADALGCAPATVRSNAARALAALRVELAPIPLETRHA